MAYAVRVLATMPASALQAVKLLRDGRFRFVYCPSCRDLYVFGAADDERGVAGRARRGIWPVGGDDWFPCHDAQAAELAAELHEALVSAALLGGLGAVFGLWEAQL